MEIDKHKKTWEPLARALFSGPAYAVELVYMLGNVMEMRRTGLDASEYAKVMKAVA